MSDCEQIAQVTHDKWANVSDSLRLLRTNERMSKLFVFFEQITHFLFCSQKMSNSVKKFGKIVFFVHFYNFFEVFKKAKVLLIPSEQIAQVAQEKWVTMSHSFRSLRRNQQLWANRSGHSPKTSKWANRSLFEQIAHLLTFLAKNERFSPKFDERSPNPAPSPAHRSSPPSSLTCPPSPHLSQPPPLSLISPPSSLIPLLFS